VSRQLCAQCSCAALTWSDGGGEWTLPMLCRWIERSFGKRLPPASVARRLDVS
jgi:hypothetical protein